jgi:hypothetical protein
MAQQNKSCLTCGWYANKECSKGIDAKKFCLGNADYELWEPLSEEIKQQKQINLEKAQEAEVLEDFHEEENFEENQEEVAAGDIDEEEAAAQLPEETKESLMAMGLSEEQAENLLKTAKIAEDEKTFVGYNGVRKPDQIQIVSDSCDGCKNDSQFVGCFINKYSECVSNGRYLFQHTEGEVGTTTGLEGKEDEELKKHIKKQISLDDLLAD